MKNKEHLEKRISELESLNDQLISEINYLNKILKKIGFDKGISTLKFAAEELLEQNKRNKKE